VKENKKLEEQKKQIREKLQKTVELAKNLPEPKNQEQQAELDNIADAIKDLSDYISKLKQDLK